MATSSKSGSNTFTGGAGNEHINGGSGADILHGMGGADRINAGSGDDVIDGGAGGDIVSGDAGNDLAVYVLGENAGATDVYDGGSGVDALRLVMTRAEWQSPAVQADLARYLVFLAQQTNPQNGQASNANFTFSFGLTVSKFESLQVMVDGVAMDPRDQAVTLGDDAMSAGEDTVSVAVDVLANDSAPDLIATLTHTQPAHGSVTLTRTSGAPAAADTASFVYTPSSSHWQYLAAGETATDTFTYTVTDSDGDTRTATVTVTITGANDAPTITSAVTSGAVAEDGSTTASGAIAFADVDLSDAHSVSSSADGAGYLGTFSASMIDDGAGDGAGSVAWSFAVDNAAVQHLAVGQTLTQTYTVTVSDGQGGTVSQPVTVTITGANDAPVITAADTEGGVSEVEPAAVQAASTPVMLDTESNDAFGTAQVIDRAALRVAPNANLADAGDPSITIQGAIASPADQDVYRIDLQPGETLTLDIDFAGIRPGVGGLDSFVFLYDAAGNVLNFNDDSSTSAGGGGSNSTQDSFLQFVAASGGTFYVVVRDFDQFGQSSAGTYSLQVSVDSQNLQLTDTGSIAFADVDLTDGHAVSVAAQGAGYLGALTAAVSDASTGDGAGAVQWTFSVANAAVQFLAEGETLTQSYVVSVADGHGGVASQTVTVTLTGDNDRPTISTAFSAGEVVENGALTTAGAIAFDDVDLIDVHSVSSAAESAGYLGTFSASISDAATGAGAGEIAWTFTASDAEVRHLAAGQSLLQRYIVTVADGHGGTTQQLVNITIVGTNDAPTITSAVTSGAVAEDGSTTASGAIAFADVDLRDAHSVSSSADGAGYLGTFTAFVTDDGAGDGAGSVTWSFAVDNAAVQHLAVGQTLTQTYTVTVSDGQGGTVSQPVTVTITGANDAPVVQTVSAAATEDGAPVTAGFAADDVDSDDDSGSLTYVITSAPSEGSVVNNGDGTFSFAPGDDFQDLAAGETRDITFGYEAVDSHGAAMPGSVTITVTGVNDAPVTEDVQMGGAAVGAGFPLVFGGYYTYAAYNDQSGQVIFSLIDTNGDGVVDTPATASDLPRNGTQYYSDYNYGLAVADIDGDGDVDVVAANQEGVVSYTNVGDVTGDGAADFVRSVVHSGFVGYDVAVADLDGDGRLDVVASQYGALTELRNIGDANGDGLVNDFADRSVYTGAQGYGYGVSTADMNGDGRADILVANYYSGPNQILLNQGDADGDGQVDYLVQNLHGPYNDNGLGVDTGDLDGDGDLDLLVSRWSGRNEIVYINDGDADGDGDLEFRTIELPIGGHNLESELIDIDGDGDLDIVTSEINAEARILYNDGDTDGDGLVDFSTQQLTGAYSNYGLAVGDVDGDGDLDIVYPSLNQGGSVYLQNQGDIDGDGQLDFNRVALSGVDVSWDAEFTQVGGGGGGGSGAYEDGPAVTGSFAGDDADSDDDAATLTYAITSAPAEGSVVNNGDGTFSFLPGSDFQDLALGQVRTVSFTYTATDAHGAVSSPSTVTIRVAGTNDAPVATVDSAVTNEDASVTINVLANDSDVEGDALAVSHVNGVNIAVNGVVALGDGASVRLNADGTLTYLPAANATGPRSFSYTVTDGLGGATTGAVNLTINPVNDRPVAVNDVVSATEAGGVQNGAGGQAVTGNVLANDLDIDDAVLVVSAERTGAEFGGGVGGTVGSPLNGAYGALTLNANGSYSYVVNQSHAAVQALGAGGTLTDTFTYTVRDAAGLTDTAQLTVTINGANDAPVAQNVTLQANQLGNGGFEATPNFSGWTVSTATSGLNATSSSTVAIDRTGQVIAGDSAVAVLQFSGQVPSGYGTGYGPSITSTAFSGQAGDTVRFVYQLSSGGDQAIGTGYIRDAVTGAIVQTVFNYQTPFTGSTGVVTQDVVLSGSGNYVIEFRIGSYDATGGRAVGARMDLGFAGILRNGVSEDESFTFPASSFTAGATDPDGGTLTVVSVGASANGAVVTLNADGSVLYNPAGALDFLAAGQQLVDTFQYTISDGRGGFSTATASVTVIGRDEAAPQGAVTMASAKGAPASEPEVTPASVDKAGFDLLVLPTGEDDAFVLPGATVLNDGPVVLPSLVDDGFGPLSGESEFGLLFPADHHLVVEGPDGVHALLPDGVAAHDPWA